MREKTVSLPLVKIGRLNELDECVVSFDRTIAHPGQRLCEMTFQHHTIEAKTVNSVDIFGCLFNLREFLEEQGWNIVCYGSRIDSYAFGLARNMGGGARVYQLEMGIEPTRDNLTWILEKTDVRSVGTIREQLEYYKKWLNSVYPKTTEE